MKLKPTETATLVPTISVSCEPLPRSSYVLSQGFKFVLYRREENTHTHTHTHTHKNLSYVSAPCQSEEVREIAGAGAT
jgi:hypothetical protein